MGDVMGDVGKLGNYRRYSQIAGDDGVAGLQEHLHETPADEAIGAGHEPTERMRNGEWGVRSAESW
jgi:hypothetical protein